MDNVDPSLPHPQHNNHSSSLLFSEFSIYHLRQHTGEPRATTFTMQSMSCANCGTDEKGEGIRLKDASHVCSSNIAILHANGIIGQSTKNHANNVLPSYVMRGSLQGPTAERGLSHLLLTNAGESDKLSLAFSRNSILRTNLRLCRSK